MKKNKKKYKQLNSEERKKLHRLWKKEGKTMREIAREMGRSVSTISRELKRNTRDCKADYSPEEAVKLTFERKARHGKKIDRNEKTKAYVIKKLQDGWSPEMITGRMKVEKIYYLVSKEAIYQFIYTKEGIRLGLYKHLLKQHRERKARGSKKKRPPAIPERISIHERPDSINKRKGFGHFEGDLTFCKGQSKNLTVLIERKSRFIKIIKNESKKAADVMQKIFNELAHFPEAIRKSITFDNGKEFVRHTLLKRYLKMKTFFCDPHSPWQKGQVEHMNSMLHRYVPKSRDLDEFSHDKIFEIQELLNDLPRKCLGFKTPKEVLAKHIGVRKLSNI
ncbi:MAG: IS30 family transposase [Ignavibacteriaceae bacterium]|nr:IS30 family transposase [Ignavibacteriaceae bacterium]